MKTDSILFLIILFVLLYSCGGEQTKSTDTNSDLTSDKDSKNYEIDTETEIKNLVSDFYSYIQDEQFELLINLGSKQLSNEDIIESAIAGLKARNKAYGIPEKFHYIYYYYQYENGIERSIVNTRVENINKNISYENFSIVKEDADFKIAGYKHGVLPFYSVEEANDNNSDLNRFIHNIYGLLSNKNTDSLVGLTEDLILKQIGRAGIENLIKQRFDKLGKNKSFIVTGLKTEIIQNTVSIELILETNNEKIKNNIEKISVSERNGVFKVYQYSFDEHKPSSDIENGFESPEQGLDFFYQNIKNQTYAKIIENVHYMVFESVAQEIVIGSFTSRNDFYGTPQKITQKEKNKSSSFTSFKLDVENSKGINSYEKISFISDGGIYYLYSYEYSDKPL